MPLRAFGHSAPTAKKRLATATPNAPSASRATIDQVTAAYALRAAAMPSRSIETGETEKLSRVVGVGMAEADASAAAKHQLLAADHDLGFAVDAYPAAVRAVV